MLSIYLSVWLSVCVSIYTTIQYLIDCCCYCCCCQRTIFAFELIFLYFFHFFYLFFLLLLSFYNNQILLFPLLFSNMYSGRQKKVYTMDKILIIPMQHTFFSQDYGLACHTIYVVYVNFIYEGWHLKFPNYFHGKFIYSQRVFDRNLLRGSLRGKFFFHIFDLLPDLGFEQGPYV